MTPINISPTGWPRSSVAAARASTASGSRISIDVVGDAFRSAGQQGAGVRKHERIVVGIDDPRRGSGPLGELVGVVDGRQARADVQELADPRLKGQVAHGPGQERPASTGDVDDAGVDLDVLSPASRSTA